MSNLIFKDYVWDANLKVYFPNISKHVSKWAVRALFNLTEGEVNKLTDYSTFDYYTEWDEMELFLEYDTPDLMSQREASDMFFRRVSDKYFGQEDFREIFDRIDELSEYFANYLNSTFYEYPENQYKFMFKELAFPFLLGFYNAGKRTNEILDKGFVLPKNSPSVREFVCNHLDEDYWSEVFEQTV